MLSEQLKEAIRQSGVSISQLSRDTDIARPNLHRFLSDDPDQHRDIRLEATADKLAAYLGLSLQLGESKPVNRAPRGDRRKIRKSVRR